MFVYEKKLQYPVKIANTNPKLAGIVISQYGGPDTVEQQKDSFRAVITKRFYNKCWGQAMSLAPKLYP